jgi:flagellin-specific chaperone FliS
VDKIQSLLRTLDYDIEAAEQLIKLYTALNDRLLTPPAVGTNSLLLKQATTFLTQLKEYRRILQS